MKRNNIWIILHLPGILMFVSIFKNFTLEYAVENVEENGDGLELHGTHQLLVRAGDVTLLAKKVNSV